MKEELLHYVWRMQRFEHTGLQATTGQSIDILHPGTYNHHAGPDFLNARIRIGETIWAGNVEMHLKASDWLQHGHQNNPAYDNVILHVVLEEDQAIHRSQGDRLECLEMKMRIPRRLYVHYQRLLQHEAWIPCEQQFPKVNDITRKLWLDRLAAERLEDKSTTIARRLEENKEHWEETFFQFLAQGFGAKVNAQPFDMLARNTPLLLLSKHRNSLFQLEALLFGQSGLLAPPFEDDYPRRLQEEYRFLQKKYKLQPIPPQSWKFMRLRPANFPTIRIAQLATLLYQTTSLFSKVVAAQNLREIEHLFEVKLSNYWRAHYLFDKESPRQRKALGKTTIHLLLINTIAPTLFLYGQRKGDERYQEKGLQFLEEARAESNAIIRKWKTLGATAESAYHTQALLQLKNEYCDKKRCLECAIGNAILK